MQIFSTIGPTENKAVAFCAMGEGWHNYHHVFPWDYKAAELGNYKLNVSTAVIDLCAKLGLAYDLKTIPSDIVKKRAMRTGDGSRYSFASYVLYDKYFVETVLFPFVYLIINFTRVLSLSSNFLFIMWSILDYDPF